MNFIVRIVEDQIRFIDAFFAEEVHKPSRGVKQVTHSYKLFQTFIAVGLGALFDQLFERVFSMTEVVFKEK